MVELEQAVERILTAIQPPRAESISLTEADGRVLFTSLRARIDLPIVDTSSMDGYAVRSADVLAATKENPARLTLIGKVAAGEQWDGTVVPNSCVRLFTGSILPQGADAVVMQEDTRADSSGC